MITENNFERQQKKSQSSIRMMYDLTMAVLWSAVGIFFLIYRLLGFEYDYDPLMTSIFGGACLIYGIFRGWRGIKATRNSK
ncbi:MAG: hypothetical protein ACO29O_02525 [Chitinophagaceae bacterium]